MIRTQHLFQLINGCTMGCAEMYTANVLEVCAFVSCVLSQSIR